MADAYKTFRKNVQGKASDKLAVAQVHQGFLSPVAVILHRKHHTSVIHIFDAVVAYGDLMGIAPQIFNHLRRS